METQDHKKANQSGHEGHVGVHICHKCGWPFPNAHPSSRHRRAHKRLCGTIDGYKLDNSQDKTRLEGSDDEQFFEDGNKIPSGGKSVERTISRRSSSGVSIRSSQSTRSEDEVFADAVTDFIDSQGAEEGSYGVISRGNSLQNISKNEPDGGTKPTAGNAISDNIAASSNLLEDKELQDTQPLEGDNEKVEAGLLSENHSSNSTNSPTPLYASVTRENDNAVDQNMMQSSRTSSELDVVPEEGKEILLSKNLSGSETCEEDCEDVSALEGARQELLDTVSADGVVKTTGSQTLGNEDKVESSQEVESSGSFHALVNSGQGVEDANGTSTKAGDLVEEHDSLTDSNENAFSLAVPDALPLQEQPEIAVEDVDLKGEMLNLRVDPVTTLSVERVYDVKANAIEERCFDTNLAKPGEVPNSVHSTEEKLEQEVGQNKSIAEQNTVEDPEHISDVKASDADIREFRSEEVLGDMKTGTWKDEKDNYIKEPKYIVTSEVPEGATIGGVDDQATSEIGGVNAGNNIKDDLEEEQFVLRENDQSKVPVGEELAATSSTVAKTSIGDVTPQVEKLITAHDSNLVGFDEEVEVHGTVLNGENEVKIGEEKHNPASPETAPGFGLSDAGSDDRNDELFELERNHDQGKFEKGLDSGNVTVVHSDPDSQLTSSGVSGTQIANDNMGGEDHIAKVNADAVVKIDDSLDSNLKISEDDGHDSNLKISEDDGSSFPNSATVAEKTSDVTESERTTKQHAVVSPVDIADSSSQTDSLEGNWGSVSVLSAVSTSQASPEARTFSLEPKTVGEGQRSDLKPSVEPQAGFEQMEVVSEIEPSHKAVDLTNEPLGGKRDEEIIAKVNDWSNGKQQHHTALKTLLGEATARSRAESPNRDEDSAPQKDQIPVTNDGFSGSRENLASENPKDEAAKEEMGKEWNSPARYPVNIKSEKRRGKGRPLWAPFLCCSSVNAT